MCDLGFCLAYPPSRSANRRGYFGGAIRIVVFGASVSFGFGGLMLFWWFSVGLKKSARSFVLGSFWLIAKIHLRTSARPSFFFTPSLIARSWRGTGVYPRGDNGLGLFAFGSHPKTNITSRFTRPRCKPAGVARAGFGVIL